MTGRVAPIRASLLMTVVCCWAPAPAAYAQTTHTECVTPGYCLCITNELQGLIQGKIQHFLDQIRKAHSDGKFVIYTSVPLSTGNGSYFGTNKGVADGLADELTQRFGAVWVLNPSTPDADLPRDKAKQPDYLYLWSEVLFSAEQSAGGFDLIYFSGPRDFARSLKLTGKDDLGVLSKTFKDLQTTDPKFADLVSKGSMTERDFLGYYGFRASVSFSVGAHDEWNIIQKINALRRKSGGVGRQLPIFFDGHALPMPAYEQIVVNGNVAECTP
jgi:hypothetical protein